MSNEVTPDKRCLPDGLGPLPELQRIDPVAFGHRSFAALGYSADQMRAYAAEQVAAERKRWQKWTCSEEWDSVNDPPCHPGDATWAPCCVCEGPND